AASTLTATRLPMSTCSASYTAAIPPRPSSRVTRYLPASNVPAPILFSGWAEAIEGRGSAPDLKLTTFRTLTKARKHRDGTVAAAARLPACQSVTSFPVIRCALVLDFH